MRARVQEIDLEGIKKRDALELKNEINKATGGNLHFNNEYPQLKRLYKLLNGLFDSSHEGIHFIRDED